MNLHLNLKGKYFDEIKERTKTKEYRLYNNYWKKRLSKPYSHIYIKKGYPKNIENERIIIREYKGYSIETIKHEHFGDKPVKVFAIDLTGYLCDKKTVDEVHLIK